LKKVLSLLLTMIVAILLTGGYFVFDRYQKNPEQIVPFPYRFSSPAPAIKLDAPILIVGDRMGNYFSKFKTELASAISVDLAKPIKIQSLARPGTGLHRTLHELSALVQWPQILIYQGGSEEFREKKFALREISNIKSNFNRYQDDRIQTLLMLYPVMSRIFYEPIQRVKLKESPELVDDIPEQEYLQRLETELLLFEQQLISLVNMSKDRNTLLILTTTPVNLDIAPRKVCEFTANIEIEKEIREIRELFKSNDYKTAYGKSSKVIKMYPANAELFFLHGKLAQKMGHTDEAKKSLQEAAAFDCEPWRATNVHNTIIRRVARNHQVLLFDFALMLEQEWMANTTFFDETYPQNLYYERAMEQLGMVIKDILKL
jgi:tetratricopeptide (TPR) repeat protein